MLTPIKVTAQGLEFSGELNDSETAAAILKRLPLKVRMSRWGDEYYGNIGAALMVSQAADAKEEMEVGELAYWIPGNALCLFFGPTPASTGSKPVAASAVNPVGKVTGPFEKLKKLGASIALEVGRAER